MNRPDPRRLVSRSLLGRSIALALLGATIAGCGTATTPAPVIQARVGGTSSPPAPPIAGLPPPSPSTVDAPAPSPPVVSAPLSSPAAPSVPPSTPEVISVPPSTPAVISVPPSAPPVTSVPTPSAAPRPHPDQIIVLPGDTLYSIARRFDVPVRAVIDANHLEPPYQVVAGRTLILPQVRTHLVRLGETLYGVSRLYGVDATTLARENHMEPPYTIRTGTVLVLPASVEPAALPVTAPSQFAATPPSPSSVAPPGRSAIGGAPENPGGPPRTAAASAPPTPVLSAPAPSEPAIAPSAGPIAGRPPPRSGRSFLWPVRGRVIGHYGPGPNGTHNDGVNIAAPEGSPVLAADAGVVAYAGNELRGYGNLILIKHADGWMTAYAHNGKLLVVRGERVRRGQVIARVGATGAVGEPQLHFELRKGTRALDPVSYLAPVTASARSE